MQLDFLLLRYFQFFFELDIFAFRLLQVALQITDLIVFIFKIINSLIKLLLKVVHFLINVTKLFHDLSFLLYHLFSSLVKFLVFTLKVLILAIKLTQLSFACGTQLFELLLKLGLSSLCSLTAFRKFSYLILVILLGLLKSLWELFMRALSRLKLLVKVIRDLCYLLLKFLHLLVLRSKQIFVGGLGVQQCLLVVAAQWLKECFVVQTE